MHGVFGVRMHAYAQGESILKGKRMSKATLKPDPTHANQEYYEIRINGHLAPSWSEAFDGMQLTQTRGGETLITGRVADQAALHGLLARIRDLNLALISVTRVKPKPPARPRTHRSS
jgi:hypothetical protein